MTRDSSTSMDTVTEWHACGVVMKRRFNVVPCACWLEGVIGGGNTSALAAGAADNSTMSS